MNMFHENVHVDMPYVIQIMLTVSGVSTKI